MEENLLKGLKSENVSKLLFLIDLFEKSENLLNII